MLTVKKLQSVQKITPSEKTPTGVTPGAIASTGPADFISGLAGVSALGYGVQRYVASRRQATKPDRPLVPNNQPSG